MTTFSNAIKISPNIELRFRTQIEILFGCLDVFTNIYRTSTCPDYVSRSTIEL